MKDFVELYHALDVTTKTNEKVAAMAHYFATAPDADAAWAIYFLCGNRLKRLVPTKMLRQWAAQAAGIPDWLLEEAYHTVGDLAETLALIVPDVGDECRTHTLSEWVDSRLLPLGRMSEVEQRDAIFGIWRENSARTRFVLMKLITGAFRVGVSRRLVTRALAQSSGVPADVISHRLMGHWKPTADFFQRVIDPDPQDTLVSQPYPFCLAHPLDEERGVHAHGECAAFAAEWKWDGIRGQLIRRSDQSFIWSRGEELMEGRWPEIEAAADWLPDGTVLDGEILAAFPTGEILPFAQLQRRIQRKKIGKKLLNEVPVVFHAFDLLEHQGEDIRALTFAERRGLLEAVLTQIEHPHLKLTSLVKGANWDELAQVRERSREMQAEGLMLKRIDAPYQPGRVRGTWWKWKIEPYTIDAVLIYAQKGHGKRANLFTDYTFALWDGDQLVPIAKAYSGLDEQEIQQVDRFVRRNTNEQFGPVRSVKPELVMELAFEGIQRSRRHKSGVATRFPRIVRWRHDKQPQDANTLTELLQLLPE